MLWLALARRYSYLSSDGPCFFCMASVLGNAVFQQLKTVSHPLMYGNPCSLHSLAEVQDALADKFRGS